MKTEGATLNKDQDSANVAPRYYAINDPKKKHLSSLLAHATNPDYLSCSTLTDCHDPEGLGKVYKALGKVVPDTGAGRSTTRGTQRIESLCSARSAAHTAETFFDLEPTGRGFTTISLDVFTVKNGKFMPLPITSEIGRGDRSSERGVEAHAEKNEVSCVQRLFR